MLSVREDESIHLSGSPPTNDLGPAMGHGPADSTRVAEIMTSPVVCVDVHQDPSVLCAVFIERGIGGAPVVDALGRPVGMVSKTDLVRLGCDGPSMAGHTVSEIMQPLPVCVKTNESVARAAAVMAFENVHRVPVLGSSGQVVGIVSSLDVMGWMAREYGYVVGDRTARRHG